MAYPNLDKSFGGTPGLLYRQRLEYGIGQRTLKGDRKLLVAMHSNVRSMNPKETDTEEGTIPIPLPDLLKLNDDELVTLVWVDKFDQDIPVSEDERQTATLALEAVLYRLDEIIWRAKIIEHVRPSQGPPLP